MHHFRVAPCPVDEAKPYNKIKAFDTDMTTHGERSASLPVYHLFFVTGIFTAFLNIENAVLSSPTGGASCAVITPSETEDPIFVLTLHCLPPLWLDWKGSFCMSGMGISAGQQSL